MITLASIDGSKERVPQGRGLILYDIDRLESGRAPATSGGESLPHISYPLVKKVLPAGRVGDLPNVREVTWEKVLPQARG